MALESLYKEYHQKSKTFLYPALNIPRKLPIQPKQTYIIWENKIQKEDRKLIIEYNEEQTDKFKGFCKLWIYNSPLFHEELHPYYIFDFSVYEKDWDWFLKGRYSKFSKTLKDTILQHYGSSREGDYINSYLYPQDHFTQYSRLLGISESILKTSGELTDAPDFKKEFIIL